MSNLPELPTIRELSLLGVPAEVASGVRQYLRALNDCDAGYAMEQGFTHGGEFDGVYRTGVYVIDPKQTSAGKYLRILRLDTSRSNNGTEGYVRENSGSIHAFLEKSSGNVAKPAGWNGPAKSTSRATKGKIMWRLNVCEPMGWPTFDPHGGYLYA